MRYLVRKKVEILFRKETADNLLMTGFVCTYAVGGDNLSFSSKCKGNIIDDFEMGKEKKDKRNKGVGFVF